MVPLILGLTANASSFHSTALSFNEDEVSKNLMSMNKGIFDYTKDGHTKIYDQLYLESRFNDYYVRWKRDTMFLSSIDAITKNSNFQKIVGFGDAIAPIILQEIQERPSKLVWALNIIFGRKISKNNLSVDEACTAWVKYGKANNLI